MMQEPQIHFDLSEDQKQFQELAHSFAEKEIRPVAPDYDESPVFPCLHGADSRTTLELLRLSVAG